MARFLHLSQFVGLARSRLCRRIALAVFASIIVIEGAILVPSYRNYERDRLDRLQIAGVGAVSQWLRFAAPSGETDELLSSTEPLIDGSLLTGGALYHPDGRLIGTFGEPPGLRPGDASASTSRRSRDGLRYEIVWGPRDTGEPYILVGRLDATGVSDDLSRFLLRIVGLVLLITVFVSGTTMAILGRLVLTPILQLREKLVQAAEHPAEADRFTLPSGRNDEFGDVLASFNHMLCHVAGSIAEIARSKASLDKLNHSLEMHVEQRTQELESAITRSNQAILDLRQSEQRFRNIFEGSSDAIILIDVSRDKIIDVNPATCGLLGYERDELLALPVTAIHSSGLTGIRTIVEDVSAGRSRASMLTCRTRSGVKISVEVSAAIIDLGGRKTMLAVLRDMTERLRFEHALLSAKDAAESASRAKSEFLANMSHELRTPLNAIIGFSEIMSHELFGDLGDERYRAYTKDIIASATHLLEIINDILDVSKAEAGKLELNVEESALGPIIDASVRLVQGRADGAGITLYTKVADRLPPLRVDICKVKQVLVNLLSNAIKFTPGGGSVSVEAGFAEDQAVYLAVVDTGIGIAANDIDKAMAPFLQLDGALSRKFEGTGLGLPLTRVLMELHGGTLTLDSVVGEGTRAVARFPPERVVGYPPERRRA